ncbi:g6f-like isoform X1 [Gadus morhua]|uniref:Abhydrolase domain containing 16A, phospholipase n=1 Tax=Gadus morhua TaxID=8049 RepID=A0A8C5BDK5_GADMO|nr:uncharacterized protein LOC115554788 isoform X1 [Gadus morhua]
MEFDIYTLALLYYWMASFIHSGQTLTDREYDDIVVTELGRPTTLPCVDPEMTGTVTVSWTKHGTPKGMEKLLLSASEGKVSSGPPKFSLADPNFLESGVFSLLFVPKIGDQGLITCLVEKQERKLRKVILHALLTVTMVPASPLPYGILRLEASVVPNYMVGSITWAGPGGTPLRSEVRRMETLTKIPHFNQNDQGTYICVIQPKYNCSVANFSFNVDVKMDVSREDICWQQERSNVVPCGCDATVASFTKVPNDLQISTGSVANRPHPLACPPYKGDSVLVRWENLEKRMLPKLVYQYDRWRDSTAPPVEGSPLLQLAGPPYNAHSGFFSFLLSPEIRDSGVFTCDVFHDDKCYRQRTTLSVLKVEVSPSSTSSSLYISCRYSGISQVEKVGWSHQNRSGRPRSFSPGPGKINVNISLPITADNAGKYTCTMLLRNGQVIGAVYTVTLPTTVESAGVAAPSLLPPLSALLLLVPLVAAAVGVLLWRQRHISQRGIEQSLSRHSWEAENIYENPEDMRLTSPQGSVYMDLKPGEGDDIYRELDRSEPSQC